MGSKETYLPESTSMHVTDLDINATLAENRAQLNVIGGAPRKSDRKMECCTVAILQALCSSSPNYRSMPSRRLRIYTINSNLRGSEKTSNDEASNTPCLT